MKSFCSVIVFASTLGALAAGLQGCGDDDARAAALRARRSAPTSRPPSVTTIRTAWRRARRSRTRRRWAARTIQCAHALLRRREVHLRRPATVGREGMQQARERVRRVSRGRRRGRRTDKDAGDDGSHGGGKNGGSSGRSTLGMAACGSGSGTQDAGGATSGNDCAGAALQGACEKCIQASCCDEVVACQNDSDCPTLEDCVGRMQRFELRATCADAAPRARSTATTWSSPARPIIAVGVLERHHVDSGRRHG